MIATIFYFYEYLLRVSPNVMVTEIMDTFQVSASMVGLISTFFFFAYAPMQIPVGILMDRFGVKKLFAFSAFITGLGSILFGLANAVWMLEIGRFFIGLGGAFAFVGMVFICFHFFSGKQAALLIGMANSIAMLGAVAGGGPLSMLTSSIGWRASMIIFGFLGLIFSLIFYILLSDRSLNPENTQEKRLYKIFFSNIGLLLKNNYTWLNGIIALLFYTTTSAFANLWGTPFLEKKYDLSIHEASYGVSLIFFGWMIGGPIIGYLSDKIGSRKKVILITSILTFFTLTPVIYSEGLPLITIYLLLLFTGIFSSGELLNFSLAVEMNSKKVKATAIAITNTMVACGGIIMQPLIGLVLDLSWSRQMENGLRLYTTIDYEIALTILPITLILAAIFTIFLKEKKYKEIEDPIPMD